MKDQNNYRSKIKRTFTAIFLPVDKNRKGKCLQCGKCCRLPRKCFFLGQRKDGEFYCRIYPIRPPACRIYPRDKEESLVDDCGHTFPDQNQGNR